MTAARAHYRDLALVSDANDSRLIKAVQNPTVTLYESDGTTPLAQTIYAAATGGTTLANPFTGDSDGTIEFWLDTPQAIIIAATGSGLGSITFATEVHGSPGQFTDGGGIVASVQVALGGSGYTDGSAVTFSGGGGSAAAGLAVVTAGAVTGVTMTNYGTGYTTQPTPAFTGGSGAVAYAVLTGDPTVEVSDADGDPLVTIDVNGLLISGGRKLGVSGTGLVVPATTLFAVNEDNADVYRVMADFALTNTGGYGDVGTGRFYFRQSSGGVTGNGVNGRALEVHTLKGVGSNSSAMIGLDLSINSSVAGNGTDATVGAWLRNLGTTWGMSTPQTVDTMLLLGRCELGATNWILVQDIDSASHAVLFKVASDGTLTSRNHVPAAADAYTLGTFGNEWNIGYLNFLLLPVGSVADPTYTFAVDTHSGMTLLSAGNVVLTAGTGNYILVNSDGMTFQKALIGKQVSTPGNPSSGFDSAYFKSDDLLYRLTSAGAEARFLDSSSTLTASKNTLRTGVISPSQLVANTDDWNPTGLATASLIRLSTDASRNLTGIVAQTAGTEMTLLNIGAQNCVLKNSVTSTAANQFLLNADITLGANQGVTLWYDGTSARWRVKDR